MRVTDNTIGWTVKVHHVSGGMVATWEHDWMEVLAVLRYHGSDPLKTTDAEIIKCQYKERMSV